MHMDIVNFKKREIAMNNNGARCMLSIVVFLLLLSVFFSPAVRGGEPPVQVLVEGNTAFALDAYRKLSAMEGNLFFSPYSISTALAMTYAGARGDTEKQMGEALRFTLGQDRLHGAFAELEAALNGIQEKGHVTLNVANSLWPQKDYPLLKGYLSLVKKHYGVLITPLDYKSATEASRRMINRWVEDKTQDKIKDLIGPGVLDPMTRLVLANAIYFKGNWEGRFKPEKTKDAPFHKSSGDIVHTPFMTQKREFHYGRLGSLQALELPYMGRDLSMLVLLPEAGDLEQLEAELTPASLRECQRAMYPREVEVFLPKFKITSAFRLDDTLASMGMIDAFVEPQADFSGMDGRRGWLYIGVVLHKAFVEVNEEGTEAAAATAVGIRSTSMPPPPPVFRADRPFLFLIKENRTGSILFMGRITDPGKASE